MPLAFIRSLPNWPNTHFQNTQASGAQRYPKVKGSSKLHRTSLCETTRRMFTAPKFPTTDRCSNTMVRGVCNLINKLLATQDRNVEIDARNFWAGRTRERRLWCVLSVYISRKANLSCWSAKMFLIESIGKEEPGAVHNSGVCSRKLNLQSIMQFFIISAALKSDQVPVESFSNLTYRIS